MNNPEFHECYTCGYKWRHGLDGSHNCPEYMAKTIAKMSMRITEFEETIKTLRHDLGNAEAAARMVIAASEELTKERDTFKKALIEIATFPRSRMPGEIANEAIDIRNQFSINSGVKK